MATSACFNPGGHSNAAGDQLRLQAPSASMASSPHITATCPAVSPLIKLDGWTMYRPHAWMHACMHVPLEACCRTAQTARRSRCAWAGEGRPAPGGASYAHRPPSQAPHLGHAHRHDAVRLGTCMRARVLWRRLLSMSSLSDSPYPMLRPCTKADARVSPKPSVCCMHCRRCYHAGFACVFGSLVIGAPASGKRVAATHSPSAVY